MPREGRRRRRRVRYVRRYKPILKGYEKLLASRVTLKPKSRGIARRHADRVLEACLRGLTPDGLLALVEVWFHPAGYRRVIADLHRLVEKRPRQKRRPGA